MRKSYVTFRIYEFAKKIPLSPILGSLVFPVGVHVLSPFRIHQIINLGFPPTPPIAFSLYQCIGLHHIATELVERLTQNVGVKESFA